MTATFADLGVSPPIVAALARRSIDSPFPVQEMAIPDLIAGRDVAVEAPTGSGKTLAFGIPLLMSVGRAEPRRPRGLVLAPTRELAEQIRGELSTVAEAAGRRLLAVYGGVSYHPQVTRLRSGVDIVVATPGRLADLVDSGALTLAAVDHLVIDEADRMADMGFLPQVRRLVEATAERRQTILFSATLDGEAKVLSTRYQTDPVVHRAAAAGTGVIDARHFFWRVEHADRSDHVASIVAGSGPTMVFTRTRRGADRLAAQLRAAAVPAAVIHGGFSQRQRSRALREFISGRAEALVATDVAARGIHVDGVACVVHYDPPEDEKAYVHRSGRTARAGSSGIVVSLVRRSDVSIARALQGALGIDGRIGDPDPSHLHSGGHRIGSKPASRAERPVARREAAGSGRRDGRRRSRSRSHR